jgi:transposase
MPKKYDEQTRAKAVRLVQEHRDDYGSEYEAIKAIAGRLGMNPETVRKWLRQAEVEAGQVDGTTTAAAREIRELKRKNAELEQTVAILKAAHRHHRDLGRLLRARRASACATQRVLLPALLPALNLARHDAI